MAIESREKIDALCISEHKSSLKKKIPDLNSGEKFQTGILDALRYINRQTNAASSWCY